MQDPIVSLSVDLLLFLRLLIGSFWGILYALFIQLHPWGQYLAGDRTHYSVALGIGFDLFIAAPWWGPTNWETVSLVIVVSYIAIFIRSTYNERHERVRLPNKTLWSLDAANVTCMDLLDLLNKVLIGTEEMPQELVTVISKTVAHIHNIRMRLIDARQGQYRNRIHALAEEIKNA